MVDLTGVSAEHSAETIFSHRVPRESLLFAMLPNETDCRSSETCAANDARHPIMSVHREHARDS